MLQQNQSDSFMQELDGWTDRVAIDQLYHSCIYGPEESVVEAKQVVKRAIRQKVLESYHNGQKARPQTRQCR